MFRMALASGQEDVGLREVLAHDHRRRHYRPFPDDACVNFTPSNV